MHVQEFVSHEPAKQPNLFLIPLRAAPTHLSRAECIKDALRRIFVAPPLSEELLNRRVQKLLRMLDDGHGHRLGTWWDIVFMSELTAQEAVALPPATQLGIEPATDDWKANTLHEPTKPDEIKTNRALRKEARERRRLRREARKLRPRVEALGFKWNPDAWPSFREALKEMRNWVDGAEKAEAAPGKS